MILYHGSNVNIESIDLAISKPYKDFGRGFYLTADRQQAQRMAGNRTRIAGTGVPTLNVYEFDEALLDSPNLKTKMWDNYCVEWAAFVASNRDSSRPMPTIQYDIVYGPIANDGVNFQLIRYFMGLISIEQLVDELKFAKGITFQYYFGTEQSLKHLKKI